MKLPQNFTAAHSSETAGLRTYFNVKLEDVIEIPGTYTLKTHKNRYF